MTSWVISFIPRSQFIAIHCLWQQTRNFYMGITILALLEHCWMGSQKYRLAFINYISQFNILMFQETWWTKISYPSQKFLALDQGNIVLVWAYIKMYLNVNKLNLLDVPLSHQEQLWMNEWMWKYFYILSSQQKLDCNRDCNRDWPSDVGGLGRNLTLYFLASSLRPL